MAQVPKIQPPFVWLGKYTELICLVTVVGIAAFFRFFQLGTLPPGLYAGEAEIGLQASKLGHLGWFPGFDALNSYAPLWIWLQALSVNLASHTELALRLAPAALGTLAVLVTWLWVRSWFGIRVAWLTAFLLAVTPWAVTLSRNATAAALIPLLVAFTLWTATIAYRSGGWWRYSLFALAIVLDALSGPIGWLLGLTTLVVGIIQLAKERRLQSGGRAQVIGGGLLAAGLAGCTYLAALSLTTLKALPSATGFTLNPGTLGHNLVSTLLMFNVRGDENYRHNLAGEPMLNVFVGLMLIAGILVGISRLHQRRYRVTFIFLIILLIPVVFSSVGVPNAAHAAGALPFILLFAALGTSYLLELWYKTFPINSAARTTGQAAIIVLLGLTFYQGYTQYFRAWAASSEVYNAYNEGAAGMAKYLKTAQPTPERFVVAPSGEQAVIAYLAGGKPAYQAIEAAALSGLPVGPGKREFIIAVAAREAAVKNLKLKFPGGVLRPHYSSFNQTEIYYTYEVTK